MNLTSSWTRLQNSGKKWTFRLFDAALERCRNSRSAFLP